MAQGYGTGWLVRGRPSLGVDAGNQNYLNQLSGAMTSAGAGISPTGGLNYRNSTPASGQLPLATTMPVGGAPGVPASPVPQLGGTPPPVMTPGPTNVSGNAIAQPNPLATVQPTQTPQIAVDGGPFIAGHQTAPPMPPNPGDQAYQYAYQQAHGAFPTQQQAPEDLAAQMQAQQGWGFKNGQPYFYGTGETAPAQPGGIAGTGNTYFDRTLAPGYGKPYG